MMHPPSFMSTSRSWANPRSLRPQPRLDEPFRTSGICDDDDDSRNETSTTTKTQTSPRPQTQHKLCSWPLADAVLPIPEGVLSQSAGLTPLQQREPVDGVLGRLVTGMIPRLAFREVRRKRTSRSVISPRRLENHPSNQFRKKNFKSKERESEKRIYRSSHRDTRSKGRKEKFLWLKPYTIRERLSKSWTRPKSHLTISPPKPCPCAGRVAAELNRDWFLKSLVIQ